MVQKIVEVQLIEKLALALINQANRLDLDINELHYHHIVPFFQIEGTSLKAYYAVVNLTTVEDRKGKYFSKAIMLSGWEKKTDALSAIQGIYSRLEKQGLINIDNIVMMECTLLNSYTA
ncbi:hypothetical protein [Lysinibacillus sphaericus]|uniref:hypothetical protein n=1 Tax=Lysinibacillus sphaericus TaxID=1421 RepID=UPI0004DA8292|nr:hypothetical protein [Lysinibacillus sphaericus]KEK10220.1 hypothetical protein EP18_18775 [Lysinibacillus sphaericus]KEK11097.1 hypothetical protein EP18_14075 [Lysinibacillus sphaericus]PIJ95593.1 hypothetical protein CTN02_23065 [Lysinibacillus sphaericus]